MDSIAQVTLFLKVVPETCVTGTYIAVQDNLGKIRNIFMGSLSANQALVKASSFEKKGKANEACNLYLKVLNNFPKNTRAVFGLTRTHEFLVSKHVETL